MPVQVIQKTRNTLTKRIIQAISRGEIQSAALLAEFGKEFCAEDALIRNYLLGIQIREGLVKNSKQSRKRAAFPDKIEQRGDGDLARMLAVQKHIKRDGDLLSSIFLMYVQEHDREGIIRLADAVWFFKGKLKTVNAVDKQRANLIYLKMVLADAPHLKMTLREIASYLGLPQTDDGYSALRRKCKQLRVPFKQGKQGRKIKS